MEEDTTSAVVGELNFEKSLYRYGRLRKEEEGEELGIKTRVCRFMVLYYLA